MENRKTGEGKKIPWICKKQEIPKKMIFAVEMND